MRPEQAKLLARVQDPRTRELLSELHAHVERQASSPRALEEAAKESKKRWLESMNALHRHCTRALNGDAGPIARDIATKNLIDADGNRRVDENIMRLTIEQIRKALKR